MALYWNDGLGLTIRRPWLYRAHSVPPTLHRRPFQGEPGESAVLGNRLTVDPRTLTPLVLVRIQVPQPKIFNDLALIHLNSCRIMLQTSTLDFQGFVGKLD